MISIDIKQMLGKEKIKEAILKISEEIEEIKSQLENIQDE